MASHYSTPPLIPHTPITQKQFFMAPTLSDPPACHVPPDPAPTPTLSRFSSGITNASQLSLSLAFRLYTCPQPHPIPPPLSRFSSGIPISRMPCSLKQSQITLHIHLYQFTLYYNCLSLSQDCEFLEAEAVFHLLYLTCLTRPLTC